MSDIGVEQLRQSEEIHIQIGQYFERFNQKFTQLQQLHETFWSAYNRIFAKGLSRERIARFEHFAADESLAGEQCQICYDELVVGTTMVRLDCEGKHFMCESCAHKWFEEQKTCPVCRKYFY